MLMPREDILKLQSHMTKQVKALYAQYKEVEFTKSLILLRNIGIGLQGKLLANHLGIRD